jgi:hypothetical protein
MARSSLALLGQPAGNIAVKHEEEKSKRRGHAVSRNTAESPQAFNSIREVR